MAKPDYCAHCGRTGNVYGVMWIDGERVPLCHVASDGSIADPNCYHLVHDLGDKLGRLKNDYSPIPDATTQIDITPTGDEVDPDFSEYVDPTPLETQIVGATAIATKQKRGKRTAAQKDAANHPGVPFREAGNSPTGDTPNSSVLDIDEPVQGNLRFDNSLPPEAVVPVVGDELKGDPTPPAQPVAAVVPNDDYVDPISTTEPPAGTPLTDEELAKAAEHDAKPEASSTPATVEDEKPSLGATSSNKPDEK